MFNYKKHSYTSPRILERNGGRRWLSAALCGQPNRRQKLEGVLAFLRGNREDEVTNIFLRTCFVLVGWTVRIKQSSVHVVFNLLEDEYMKSTRVVRWGSERGWRKKTQHKARSIMLCARQVAVMFLSTCSKAVLWPASGSLARWHHILTFTWHVYDTRTTVGLHMLGFFRQEAEGLRQPVERRWDDKALIDSSQCGEVGVALVLMDRWEGGGKVSVSSHRNTKAN